MKRVLCGFLSVMLVFSFLGCSRIENTSGSSVYQTDAEQKQRINEMIRSFEKSGKNGDSSIVEELNKGKKEDLPVLLMDFADDMAKAQFYGLVNDDILAMAGKVVRDYPHPLLLNNYGALLTEIRPEDALYLFFEALDYEPQNSVILCNIANLYIQLDDFSAAERYATEALASIPDFGPAYQVLTTCHLKNGNSLLAAETMVKSARHCFNDITVHHFDTYLDAVDKLDPKTDDYPLKEEFINELYEIAKENVDTLDISQDVDIPEAQLKLNSLPSIATADDLRFYGDYFDKEQQETWSYYQEMEMQYSQYERQEDEEYNDSKNGLVFPIDKNLRQKYAFQVLRSFYVFKLEKLKINTLDALEKIDRERDTNVDEIHKKYNGLVEQNAATIEKLGKEFEEAEKNMDWDRMKEIMSELENLGGGYGIEEAKLEVAREKEILQYEEELAQKAKEIIYTYHGETKLILEEYWLRSGGLLKYVTEENAFNLLDTQRRIDVDYYIWEPLNQMTGCTQGIEGQYYDVKEAERNLKYMEASVNGSIGSAEEPESDEEQKEGEDLLPEMEEAVISTYPEKDVVGDLGIELDLFDLLSASGQYNGEDYTLEVSVNAGMLKGTIGGKTVTENGKVFKEAYTTFGVDAKISPDELIPEKMLGKTASKLLGSIKFGGAANVSQYNVMSGDNRITDMGKIYTVESGVQVGPAGKTDQVSVKRSSMTGVAIKNKSIKYKFLVFTYTVPNN